MNEMKQLEALGLPNVDEILKNKYSFFVPKYQRGYRWTEDQAKKLMYDLYDFDNEESNKSSQERCPFYSLQVLVVEDKGNNVFEVIDGQQRLTTILLLMQAYHIVSTLTKHSLANYVLNTGEGVFPDGMYEIKYETRKESSIWLKELTLAYLKDFVDGTSSNINTFKSQYRDYHHFAEVLLAGINIMKEIETSTGWEKILTQTARFIWYDKSKVPFEDANEMIFNRLNATKIKLNNAELIKALFLQEGVYKNEGLVRRDQMALDWDGLEKKLQDPEFWMFICNSKLATTYDTHIEYLFDMLQNKTDDHADRENYTFDCYYDKFQKAPDKYKFVQKEWKKVMDIYQVLQEWYEERHFYHLTGYLLEYGGISIPQLISKLYADKDKGEMMPKDQWLKKLKELVRENLSSLNSSSLVYSNKDELTRILFLFNILQEDKRKNPNARFSFNRYKRIALGLDDGVVWHLEHIASHTDYTPDLEKRQQLAKDLLEYFTGVDIPISEIKEDEKLTFRERYEDEIEMLKEKEKDLCKKLLELFEKIPEGEKEREEAEISLQGIFAKVNNFFEATDPFKDGLQFGRGYRDEKDFIWNFVLLNSRTNMSYGNSIFPVKRRRILNDENDVFTMFGTRNVFDKTYSRRLSNLMSWGRRDAYDYWMEITNTLKEYLPDNFGLPSYIKI
jgi:hypothetical protein